MAAAERLETIQAMRGVAATAVMLFHFAGANKNFCGVFPTLGSMFQYGGMGVWMFFVISGFVIPHTMDSKNYRIDNGARPFLLRRIVRLEPPYIASVLIACAIAYIAALSPGYRGGPFVLSLRDFLLQFLYVGPWFGVPWVNAVAWTLAIEFQYYLLMLAAAPLLLSRSYLVLSVFVASVVASSLLIEDPRAVFIYLPCFGVGFAVFLFHSERVGRVGFAALCALFVGLLVRNMGIVVSATASVSAALILLPIKRPVPVLSALGTISYSLYLIHVPIGERVINLAMRIHSSFAGLAALTAAIAASLLAAAGLWYIVERPAHLLGRVIASSAQDRARDRVIHA